MILSILLPYNARYHKEFGAQLWFFYKQLSDFRNELDHFAFVGWEKNHISPEQLPEDCWERDPATLKKLEYSIPEKELIEKQNVTFVDQKIFADLEEKFKSNNLVWRYLMTRPHEPLMQFLKEVIANSSKKEPVEAMILSCNLPSAEQVGRELGIPVIHTEIGPTRKPQYLQTAYWDLSGVNGNTEAALRFEKAKDELSSNLLTKRELLALFMNEEEFKAADALEDNIDYETGLAGQVDDDSNIIAYSKGFNNQELQRFADFHFGQENVLFRSHPAAQSYFTSRLDRSPSTVHFFKRIKQLVTINSSMALEASLFGKPVMVMGDSPFSILSDDLLNGRTAADGHIRELNFLYLNYIIPYELMFDYGYYKWRLSFPSEQEIRDRHLDFYLKKKGFSSLEEFKSSIPEKNPAAASSCKNEVLDIKAHDIPGLLWHEKDLVKWCQMQADAITSLEERCRRLEFQSQTGISVPASDTVPAQNILPAAEEKSAELINSVDSTEQIACLAEKYFSNELEFLPKLALSALPRSTKKISTIAIFYFRMHTGGVERTVSKLLEKLVGMGYKTVLLTDETPDSTCYPIPAETSVKVFSSGRLRNVEASCIKNRADEWKQFIESENIDAVLYNDSLEQHAIWDLCAAKLAGAYFIMHSHEYCAMDMFSLTKFTALNTWKFADGLICLSRVDAAWWKTLGCNSIYIPNLLSVDRSDDAAANKENCDILWAGRISPEKAPLDAVYAFEKVVQKIPEARLIMAGCPETPQDEIYLELKKAISEKNLGGKVVLAGFVNDIEKYYRNSALYLSTSRAESFQLTIFEAKANSLGVVSYDLPNLELLRETRGNILVEQGNWKSLAEEIVKLLENPQLCRELGKAGKESLAFFCNYPYEEKWKAVFSAIENGLPLAPEMPAAEDIGIALKNIMRDGETIYVDLVNSNTAISDKLVFETAYYQKLLAERDKDIENYKNANSYNESDARTLAAKLASETAHYQKLLAERDVDTANYKAASEYNEKAAKELAEKLASEISYYQRLLDERDVDIKNYREAYLYNEQMAKELAIRIENESRACQERMENCGKEISELKSSLDNANIELEKLQAEKSKVCAELDNAVSQNRILETERERFPVRLALKISKLFKK